MCLDCIPQKEPPTPELARSRLLLQLLAAGLFITSLFALLAGESFGIFFMMIMAFILYLSWSQFSPEMTLNFFLIAFIQVLEAYVGLLGLFQYYDMISSQNSAQVLYIIAKMVYYPNAVFFSHEAYRHFKQFAKHSGPSFGDYQLMPMGNKIGPQPVSSSQNFQPFRGQAIVIG